MFPNAAESSGAESWPGKKQGLLKKGFTSLQKAAAQGMPEQHHADGSCGAKRLGVKA